MKAKMHQQIYPRETFPPRSERAQAQVVQEEVQEEIQNFLMALNSYAARVAQDPSVSFQQHLGSFFAACTDIDTDIDEDRRARARRQ
jgi:hypothetical protein